MGDVEAADDELVLVDHPRPHVARVTLNRPERQASILKRMRATAWVCVALAAYTTWVGLRLLH